MNTFEVTGRLTDDIKYKTNRAGEPAKTKLGKSVAGGAVADQHSKKAGDVSYFNFVLYGEAADTAVKQFTKGEMVHIKGWMKQQKWTDKNGNKRSNFELRVIEINPVYAKSKEEPEDGDEEYSWA